jgi:hypothetical protein
MFNEQIIYKPDALFPVNAVTFGFNYDLVNIGKTKIAAGSQFTYYSADARLDNLYGKNPMAFEIFLRLFPDLLKM